MTARLDSNWQYNGLRALVLDNPALQITILPETGARVYNIIHKPTDTNFLWHHPRNLPRHIPYGSNFDNTWPGGWDEVLPSTEETEYRGEKLPHMGELWSRPWEWHEVPTDDESACVYTGVSAAILPLRFERWMRLDAEEPVIHLRYRLTNLGLDPLDLNWGIHPLFAITPHHKIDLPACKGLVGQSNGARMGEVGQTYEWPHLPTTEGMTDVSRIQPYEANIFAGHYGTELSSNWFALTDTQRQVGIGMVFPTDIFRVLWMWQVYGGWRGLYHLAIEPWIGYPVRLEQAIAAGRQRILSPGQPIEYELAVVAYTGVESVTAIESHDGHYRVIGPTKEQMDLTS